MRKKPGLVMRAMNSSLPARAAQQLLEVRAADAFGQRRSQNDGAAAAHDVERAGQTFDRLIEGVVERIAAG